MNLKGLLLVVLCIGIAVQMLGAPVSFFHFDDPSDLVESSILEGFSIASDLGAWNVSNECSLASLCTRATYHFSNRSDVFHPPLATPR